MEYKWMGKTLHVPQFVLEKINTRYGGLGPDGSRRFASIDEAVWMSGSHEILDKAVVALHAGMKGAEGLFSVEIALHGHVGLNTQVTFPDRVGMCDMAGNEVESFHVSENDSHPAVSMLMQIVVGAAVERGIIEEWGKISFDEYFGYGKVSGTFLLGSTFKGVDARELLVGATKIVITLERLTFRPSKRKDVGSKLYFSSEAKVGRNREGEWCHLTEQRAVIVASRSIPKESPLVT